MNPACILKQARFDFSRTRENQLTLLEKGIENMGTTIHSNTTRKELVEGLLRTQYAVDPKTGVRTGEFKTIAHCFKGNNVWAVHERTFFDGREPLRFVAFYLITRFGQGEWGYKDMDETCGPCYYNCPVSYLDMAPNGAVNDYAKEWRQKVRELAESKKKAAVTCKDLEVGTHFWNVQTGRAFEVFKSDYVRTPRGYVLGRTLNDGKIYKVRNEDVLLVGHPFQVRQRPRDGLKTS
jgi:hypothetical protein